MERILYKSTFDSAVFMPRLQRVQAAYLTVENVYIYKCMYYMYVYKMHSDQV